MHGFWLLLLQKKGGGMGSGMAGPSGGMRQQGMPKHEQGSFNAIQQAVSYAGRHKGRWLVPEKKVKGPGAEWG